MDKQAKLKPINVPLTDDEYRKIARLVPDFQDEVGDRRAGIGTLIHKWVTERLKRKQKDENP